MTVIRENTTGIQYSGVDYTKKTFTLIQSAIKEPLRFMFMYVPIHQEMVLEAQQLLHKSLKVRNTLIH